MLKKDKIAVLGANKPLEPFYRQAQNLGYEIIGIATEDGAICKKYCSKFYPISFADKDKVVEICRHEKIDGILSFSLESACPTVSYVAEKLGLVGNTLECITLTSNKFEQRKALQSANIPVPQYYLITNENDLDLVQCRFPIIVKPVDSGGSQGICKIDTPQKLKEAFLYAKEYSKTGTVIIEEFIDGREFSVEYISHNGKHYFIQITDKVTSGAPRFVEMQHHQPANISDDIKARIKTMVEEALSALKISNSASHTEIKLNTRNELFIIETGARMGGGYITSDLVRLSTGYDFVEGAIKLAVNDFEKPRFSTKLNSGIYFYSKMAPHIKDFILNHDKIPEIIEWEYSSEPLVEVKSNADRRGFFIYQKKNGKLTI